MKYIMQDELAMLSQTGKLSTHPHIHCVQCDSKTTAFGTNLLGKIQKMGGLEPLLSTFACRACRNIGKPVMVRVNKGVKRTSKRKPKELRASELIKHPPSMAFAPRERLSLLQHPALAAEVTAIACARPDIYLDAARSCDYCNLYQLCAAPCRRLSKHGWQVHNTVAA
jgi:hypothetical protein